MKRVISFVLITLCFAACHGVPMEPRSELERRRSEIVDPISGFNQTGVSLNPTQDTYVTEHPVLGGSDSTHGSALRLYAIGTNGYRAYTLVQFDVSSFAGETVDGPATLELFVDNPVFGQSTRTVSVHNVVIPWEDTTATFNNFGADPGVQSGADIGSALDVQDVPYEPGMERYVGWTIPQSIVQSWIDNPASNFGILVLNESVATQMDLGFHSMEWDNPPRLTFSITDVGGGGSGGITSDSFDGTIIDECRWNVWTTYDATISQNEQLILSPSGNHATSVAKLATAYQFLGDFDVQVDFGLGEGWTHPVSGHLSGAVLEVNIDGIQYQIVRIMFPLGSSWPPDGKDQLWLWKNTPPYEVVRINSSELSGKFRVRRAGSILYFKYDFGSGWQQLGSVVANDQPATILLATVSIDAGHALTTYFDDFIVNTGTTTFSSCAGAVGGKVWLDGSGVEGVTVRLLDENGLPVGTPGDQVTDTQGDYAFTDLSAGVYRVMVVEPPGYSSAENPIETILEPSGSNTVDFFLIEEVLSVEIDIKPGSYPNLIYLGTNVDVPIAILSSPGFDATTVDPSTVVLSDPSGQVTFGPVKSSDPLTDVDDDGLDDLVVYLDVEGLSTTGGTINVVLTGDNDHPVQGTDSVEVPANVAPTIDAYTLDVSVVEGEMALNGGSVGDANGDAVILNASVGTVTNNGDGTWSWSFATSNGPTESQSVTIGAADGKGGTSSLSFALTVNNAAPAVDPITALLDPVQVGTQFNASADFTDPGTGDAHTAIWDWGDETVEEGTVTQGAGAGSVNGDHTYMEPGVYEIVLTVTDNDGGSGQSAFQYVVVYDPAGGFVTGGGWINSPEGAYVDPSVSGKASFGFVSKYKKNADTPTGNTQFQFRAGALNFHSDVYDWLVVNQSGANAQFKGSGTINGTGDYRFMIWAGDNSTDTFRIKIWEDGEGEDESVVYDNGFNQAIDGGSIKIHN